METIPVSEIIKWWNNFYYSDFMLWVKFALGAYTAVLFIDIVLLLILQGRTSWRIIKSGANIEVPSSKKIKKEVEKFDKFLKDKNPSFWKIAVLEIDNLINQVLDGFGYQGKDLGEKLAKISSQELEYYDELKKAHMIRNRIIKEKDFSLTQKEAKEIVGIYKQYLETVNLLN